MKLYHYTSTMHLSLIEEDGFLKPVESNISMAQPHAGPDVVWLTTSFTRRGLSWARGSMVDKTDVRITVDVEDAEWWPTWAKRQGIDPDWYRALDLAGGNTAERWYVVARSIPREEWIEIEVFE